jgi:hypothetical protein
VQAFFLSLPPTGLAMRPVNAAAQLAAAQSGRKEAAKKEKGVFREALVHPPDARPRTPAKGYALCTPKNCRGERGHPRQGACKAPWSPVLKRHKVVRSSI